MGRGLAALAFCVAALVYAAAPASAKEGSSCELLEVMNSFLGPEVAPTETPDTHEAAEGDGFWIDRRRVTLRLKATVEARLEEAAPESAATGLSLAAPSPMGGVRLSLADLPGVPAGTTRPVLHLRLDFGIVRGSAVARWLHRPVVRRNPHQVRDGFLSREWALAFPALPLGLGHAAFPESQAFAARLTPLAEAGLATAPAEADHVAWLLTARPLDADGPAVTRDLEWLGLRIWVRRGSGEDPWPEAVTTSGTRASPRAWLVATPPPDRAPGPRWSELDDAVVWLVDLGYRFPRSALRLAARLERRSAALDLRRFAGEEAAVPGFALAIQYFLRPDEPAAERKARLHLLLSVGVAGEEGEGRLLFGPQGGYGGGADAGAVRIQLAWRLEL